MIWYLDTSLALHALLPTGDARAAEWLDQANSVGSVYSSTLLELEIIRVLRRERLAGRRVNLPRPPSSVRSCFAVTRHYVTGELCPPGSGS